jgi:WD40 repeat protein
LGQTFSSDGQHLVTVGQDEHLALWKIFDSEQPDNKEISKQKADRLDNLLINSNSSIQ